jgi:hypothetical protein
LLIWQNLVSGLRNCTEKYDNEKTIVRGLLTVKRELEQKIKALEKDLNEFKINMVIVC